MSTEEFKCPEEGCEQSFGLARALQRHLHQTHGHPSYAERVAAGETVKGARSSLNGDDPGLESDERDRLETLAAPLRESIAADETRLVELEQERAAIRERIRPIRTALNALTQYAKPGPKSSFPGRGPGDRVEQGAKKVSERSIERVSTFIERHAADLSDEFAASELVTLMRSNGEGINVSDLRRVLRELHKRGMIRLVSSDGPGGRKMYARLPAPFVDRERERVVVVSDRDPQ